MNTSEQINEIAGALAKAQAIIINPSKDKVNPHFNARYADLASGLDCIRPALSAHGIAFIQATEITNDSVILRTRMIHSSGQWIESTYPVAKFIDHQKLGSALTYAKRQALFSLVGVCGDDDLDGEDSLDVRPAGRDRPASPPAQRQEPDESVNYYVNQSLKKIAAFPDVPAMKAWWAAEDIVRRELEIMNGSPEYSTLFEAFKARGLALSSAATSERAA
jgi:hypothetical protein